MDEMFEKGDRIVLIFTSKKNVKIKSGDKGTVLSKNTVGGFQESQIWIQWDNGSDLALTLGVDKFRRIKKYYE